jgi:hypothetical protein
LVENYIEKITKQGDSFDMISLQAYGSEFMSHIIIQANPEYSDVIKFPPGINIRVPIINSKKVEVLPPWKR